MGIVADFASLPEDVWLAVLPCVWAAGIEISAGELERGVWWYVCNRGEAKLGLAYSPEDRGREVVVFSPVLRFWRRPLSMWRLFRDVRRAVWAAGGRRAEF